MSASVLLAVLFAAFLHAGWNALIKTGASKQSAMLLLSLGHALCGLALVWAFPLPPVAVWPWLALSAVVHTAYQLFLSYAYDQGDLSRVYPIARGAAPMIVLLLSPFLLDDRMAGQELFGVIVLGLGIALMARGVFSSGESRKLLPFALGSACATAGYTLTDGFGARVWGEPLAFTAWLMIGSAALFSPVVLVLRGPSVLRINRKDVGLGLIAAAASFISYAIAIWAMTKAPLALVAALRETSILFAVFLGWAVFGDQMDRGKIFAASLIVAGVVLTRVPI